MKKRISRHQQMQQNPIALALMAQHHHDILTDTRIADQLALQAVEAGTASAADITRLDYLAAMLLSLAHAGFGFAGITTAELQALCRAALAALDAGSATPGTELNHCDPGPAWRRIDALHQVQLDACSPLQYLRARCSLLA